MQKHIQHYKDERHSSLEKYTFHFIWKGSKGLLKVLLCERWVWDWTEPQHIDPHSYGHNGISFQLSWAAQPGAWGPSLSGTWSSFQHLLSNWLELPVHRVILLIWRPSSSCERHNFALNSICLRSRLYPDIPRPDAPVIYTGAFSILTAWPGRRSICNIYSFKQSYYNWKNKQNFN